MGSGLNIKVSQVTGTTKWADTWYTGSSDFAIDGDRVTKWTYEGLGGITFDLGKNQIIDNAVFYFGGSVTNGNYVEIYVDENKVVEGAQPAGSKTWDLGGIIGRYIEYRTVAKPHNEYGQIATWSELAEATFNTRNDGNSGSITSSTAGVFQEGVTLTAPGVTGDPDGDAVDPNYAYQWYKDGTAIADATASTYFVPGAGAGNYKVAITYTDAQNFRSTVDSPDQVVSTFNNGNGTPGSITGNGAFREGVTLTAPVVTGDPDGDSTSPNYSYQWFKDSTAITNAAASSYAVPASGAGNYKVAITYTDAQNFRSTVDSPDQDVLTGERIIDLNTATGKFAGDDGIIDRFTLQTNAAPATPWRISEFNSTEDILQIPAELASRTAAKSFFGVQKVVIPDRPLTKREQKSYKKQQKAVSKSVKRIGRTGDGFIYNQLTGELFVDTNGRKKGFGEGGGLLAVLEDTPAIGLGNFEFL